MRKKRFDKFGDSDKLACLNPKNTCLRWEEKGDVISGFVKSVSPSPIFLVLLRRTICAKAMHFL